MQLNFNFWHRNKKTESTPSEPLTVAAVADSDKHWLTSETVSNSSTETSAL
jgi:hypothetical protein